MDLRTGDKQVPSEWPQQPVSKIDTPKTIPLPTANPASSRKISSNIKKISQTLTAKIAVDALGISRSARCDFADVYKAFRNNDNARFHFIHIDGENPARFINAKNSNADQSLPTSGHLIIIDKSEKQILMDTETREKHGARLDEILYEASYNENSEINEMEQIMHGFQTTSEHDDESKEHKSNQTQRPRTTIPIQQNKPSSQEEVENKKQKEKLRLEANQENRKIQEPTQQHQEELEKVEELQKQDLDEFIQKKTQDEISKQGNIPQPGTHLGRKDWELIYIEGLHDKMTSN